MSDYPEKSTTESLLYFKRFAFCDLDQNDIYDTAKDVIYSRSNGVIVRFNPTAAASYGTFSRMKLSFTAIGEC